MKTLKYICLLLIGIVFIVGCSGDYGTVRGQRSTDNKMTIAELKENWEDYDFYVGRQGGRIPKNIMFDPKNDEIQLVGDGWYKIADHQTLSETISAIQTNFYNQEVMIIEGPDKRFFGYIYYGWGQTNESSFTPSSIVRLVGEHTVHVSQGT